MDVQFEGGAVGERIITRDELGRILPYGWAIQQNGLWFTAFLGDEMQLTPQRSVALAIAQVRAVLATTIANTSRQLQESLMFEQMSFLDEVKGGKRSAAGAPAPSQTLDPNATK